MHLLIPAVSRFTQLTGICRHAVNHAKAAAEIPDVSRVTLLVGSWQVLYFREALQDSNPSITFKIARCNRDSLSRNLWYSRELPRIAANVQADIVHLSCPAPIWRSRFTVPVAATIHDLYPLDHPENFGFPAVLFNRIFLKQCLNQSAALACVSSFTHDRLLHHFPSLRVRKLIATISSYSELAHSTASPPANLQCARFILTVGQHRANKNLGLVIRAYASLVRSASIAPDTGLVIAGAPGLETGALKSLVKQLALDQRVAFLHALTDANLAWLYRNCELFVAASSIEGFCLPLLEARELSPRIVCSDIPIFQEVATNDCEFFSLGASPVDSLANAIHRALQSPGQQCRSRDSRFTRTAASRAYAQLYSHLLNVPEVALSPASFAG